jgi:hypothetical protein
MRVVVNLLGFLLFFFYYYFFGWTPSFLISPKIIDKDIYVRLNRHEEACVLVHFF